MTSVLTPLVTMLLVGAAFFLILQLRSQHAAIGLGTIFAAAVLLYAIYPLLMYWLLNGYYTPLNDGRLFADQPPPADIGRIAWYYCAYLASFCAGYLLRPRRKKEPAQVSIVELDASTVWSLFTIFILLRCTLIAADMLFAEQTTGYAESYLKYKHLPLLAQQLLGHANGIAVVLSIMAMAFLTRRWDKYRLIIVGWITFELLLLVTAVGARTQFVMLCLSALFSYHFLYRQISASKLAASGVLMIVAFLGLGILRHYGDLGVSAIGVEAIASNSEFESSFANTYDVERLVSLGDIDRGSMFFAVYFGDVINLIPQQISPFEKLNLSNWYVDTFYSQYAEGGGGLAFGAIPEALLGTGWPDLIWRAALVGFMFRWFDEAILRGAASIWKFTLYLWLLVTCYQTFRQTTLAVVPLFVYRFVPAILVVMAFAYLLRAAAGGTRTDEATPEYPRASTAP